MKLLNDKEIKKLRLNFLNGDSIVSLLKSLLKDHPEFGPGHLIFCLMDAFGVTHDDISCIGGWWPDGTSELSDQDIESKLKSVIENAYKSGKWGSD
ncbi:MAG: hypothetical protein HWN51_04100 [Desulfobacterales bacterium]|nr:hypothetical protein [Desulfobacterales bacterium]